jgi:hypothetical protein
MIVILIYHPHKPIDLLRSILWKMAEDSVCRREKVKNEIRNSGRKYNGKPCSTDGRHEW